MGIKNYIKTIFIVTFLLLLFSMFFSHANAASLGGVIEGADSFIEQGSSHISDDKLQDLSSDIYNILLVIGVVVAVIVGAILGIQFMTGSVEQKGKIKEALIPYAVGCVVIFGAFGIWKLVVEVLGSIA